MINTIARSWKKLAAPVAFLAFFLLLGLNQATAQSVGMKSAANPKSQLAQKYGVQAYNVGTWTQNNVVQILEANIPQVKDQSFAPLADRMTYSYYTYVMTDIKSYKIAPEVALLLGLQKVQDQFKGSLGGRNNNALIQLYNNTVSLF